MSTLPKKRCDNKSVGIVIRDKAGNYALLKRAIFPSGIAPVAGHVDGHGTVEQAALDEVNEEVGLVVTPKDLHKTEIVDVHFNNVCHRPGGGYHHWWVFSVDHFSGEIQPDPRETKGARWYKPEELEQLAERTRHYRAGDIDEQVWEAEPGLEPIWLDMLTQLGYLNKV